ncbi:MAG: dynamin family protein [Synergistaceae bacterium]|nr:dynamin family protein [Synergistaceae bacterium]
MTPLWEDFLKLGPVAGIGVRFPSGEVEMSAALLAALRLTADSRPRDLDQWRELCHPADHERNREMERALADRKRAALSLTRRLYCGDGVYRPFRLEAAIRRGRTGEPLYLMGVETPIEETPEPHQGWMRKLEEERDRLQSLLHAGRGSFPSEGLAPLTAWLQTASDGDRFETRDAWGRLRLFEARLIGGERALVDLTELRDAEEENARLRFQLQRRSLRGEGEGADGLSPAPLLLTPGAPAEGPSSGGKTEADVAAFRSELERGLTSAIQVLAKLGGKGRKGTGSQALALASRTEQLQGLLRSLREKELVVGVVGLTSSGKSTFINAMMGERLLPEETRATTNLMILCRRGGVRAADVFYQDGRVERASGSELTPEWMEERASERRNPDNQRGIARIEWSSPVSVVPPGLALADTPGLDACDLPKHGDLVLRRLLPSLDIVLYLTSIRTRFKVADVELMNAILDGNQRLILLLSQIDLERDETEAGHVLLSRSQKLARALADLRADLDLAKVPPCPVIPISSRLALENFSDRGSEEWKGSNFDPLIRQLSLFRRHIVRYGAALRGRRAVGLLERTLRDLSAPDSPDDYDRGQSARIRALRDAQRWISAELSSVRNEWNRQLDEKPILARFERELRAAETAEAFRAQCLRWESSWLELVLRMTERMDRAREVCRQTLGRLEIPALQEGQGEGAESGSRGEFPAEVRQMEARFRSQGRLDGLAAKFSRGRDAVIQEGKALFTARLSLLKEHMNWWENRMREVWCDPVYRELKREEAAAAAARSLEGDPALTPKALDAARSELRGIAEAFKKLLAGDGTPPELADMPEPALMREAEPPQDAGLFDSLLLSMQEEGLRGRFLLLPSLSAGNPPRGQASRRLLLLGLRRHDGLRLLSRLMHEANVSDVEADEGQWLFSGRGPAPTLPRPCAALPEDPGGLEFLVAPSDPFCEGGATDWPALFARWTPVVHLDLARVDSGLSDLARAPYAAELAASAPRWILAFAHGGLFDNRLSDLILDVTERVRLFTGRRGFQGRMDWFIYENYDSRYTDFLSLGKRVKGDADDEEVAELASLWDEWDLSGEAPFTRERLIHALTRVRDRLRADAARPT